MKSYSVFVSIAALSLSIFTGCSTKNTEPLQVAPLSASMKSYCSVDAPKIYDDCYAEMAKLAAEPGPIPINGLNQIREQVILNYNTGPAYGPLSPNGICLTAQSNIMFSRFIVGLGNYCISSQEKKNQLDAENSAKRERREEFNNSFTAKALWFGMVGAVIWAVTQDSED